MKLLSEDSIKFVCPAPIENKWLEQINGMQRFVDGAFLDLAFRSSCMIVSFSNDNNKEKLPLHLKISVKVELAENREELLKGD